MNTNSSRAARSLISALRMEGVVVVPETPRFRQKCFGSLVRACRAMSAWESRRGDLVERLDDLFAYFVANFDGEATPEECRRVLSRHAGKAAVTEVTFPVLITKFILRNVRIDLSTVPSFAPWAVRYERAVLAS